MWPATTLSTWRLPIVSRASCPVDPIVANRPIDCPRSQELNSRWRPQYSGQWRWPLVRWGDPKPDRPTQSKDAVDVTQGGGRDGDWHRIPRTTGRISLGTRFSCQRPSEFSVNWAAFNNALPPHPPEASSCRYYVIRTVDPECVRGTGSNGLTLATPSASTERWRKQVVIYIMGLEGWKIDLFGRRGENGVWSSM